MGRRASRVLGGLWLACAGCAQLVGIDETSGPGSAAVGSTLQVSHAQVGATVVQEDLPVAGLPLPKFNVGSGQVTATVENATTWGIPEIADSVQFTLPDPNDTSIHLAEYPNTKVLFSELTTPDTVPAQASSQVNVMVTLDQAFSVADGDSYQVFDVGAWSAIGFAGSDGDLTIATTLPYSSFTSQTGHALQAIGPDDQVLTLHYRGAKLIGELDSPGVVQSAGSDTFMGSMSGLPSGLNAMVSLPGTSEATRLAATSPPGGAASGTWSLVAAPGAPLVASGPQLDAEGGIPLADTVIADAYANPWVGSDWDTVFTWIATANRTAMPTAGSLMGQPIPMLEEIVTQISPSTTGSDTITDEVGVPTSISIGETALGSDAIVASDDPTTPLVVSMAVDHANDDAFEFEVIETALGSDGTTVESTLLFQYLGPNMAFTLPANTLQAGHTYRIRAATVLGGLPNVSTGDTAARSYPLAVAVIDSGLFSMGAPL